MTVAIWPTVNAILNATSAVLLLIGFGFVRAHRLHLHARCMVAAFVTSTLFFLSYVIYHVRVGSMHFRGQGWMRPVYFAILISHTILAIVIVPLVLRTLFLAVRQRIAEHRRWAHLTLPLWLYVCVTGVVVYWLLYWWQPA